MLIEVISISNDLDLNNQEDLIKIASNFNHNLESKTSLDDGLFYYKGSLYKIQSFYVYDDSRPTEYIASILGEVKIPVISKKIENLEADIKLKDDKIYDLKVQISDLRLKEKDFVHKDFFFESLAASNGRRI